ncbi:MAG: rod shape-determining protein MreC [Candidatus Parcubacteria bacterium]|nr:rod shape-determining protein MreC [Candidatus Parcubacteria bacterium]
MKKTFLAKRNALLSSASISWGTGALACAVLVLLVRLIAPNFFLQAFAPAFNVSNIIALKSHAFFNSFGDTAALAARNEQLMEENAALASENQALLEKEASVGALIGASASQKTANPGILAGVMAHPPVSPYDTIVLSVGSNSGVTLGMEAFGEGGVPLGAISSVTTDFSRATLFSAPGMVTHGWIKGADMPLNIFGAGGGAMNASLSRSAGVNVGDTVFAPGPGMLPIGSVVRIDSDPSAPGISLRIMPTTNPSSLTWVLLRDTGTALTNLFFIATSTP